MMNDDEDAVKWFAAVFEGRWREVPRSVPVPPAILDESREWAAELLAPAASPYASAHAPLHAMHLGQGTSPDKLVTGSDDGGQPQIVLIETLHHFVVSRPPQDGASAAPVTSRRAALETIRADLVPVLATSAGRVVDNTIDDSMAAARQMVSPDEPVLLSPSALSLSAMSHWSDRVSLFWLRGEAYIDFYKLYRHMAAPLFRPGLNWFPDTLRATYGPRAQVDRSD